jgi:lysine N6-hydroxylase
MGIDLIGVGAGPANLSLAALLTTARERGLSSLSSVFLERNSAIFWHSQQMFPGTLMQTEFYRDLVTPIDPTRQVFVLELFKIECSIGAVFLFFDHLPNAPGIRGLF